MIPGDAGCRYQLELSNKIRGGRAVGNEYVITQRPIGLSEIIKRFDTREAAEAWLHRHCPGDEHRSRKKEIEKRISDWLGVRVYLSNIRLHDLGLSSRRYRYRGDVSFDVLARDNPRSWARVFG